MPYNIRKLFINIGTGNYFFTIYQSAFYCELAIIGHVVSLFWPTRLCNSFDTYGITGTLVSAHCETVTYLLQEFDDDELEAELDALGEELELEEQEELDKQLLDVGPAVPTQLPEVSFSQRVKYQQLRTNGPHSTARGEHKLFLGPAVTSLMPEASFNHLQSRLSSPSC